MANRIISVNHITKEIRVGKSKNKIKLIDDISFEINKGEFLSIVGPSGSGKSTLLNVVGWAGIWFRIDGKNFNQLKFDNMEDRPIVGTNTWNYYSSVLDVPDEAERLVFGFLLQGPGILWADDFSIHVVGNDVKTTDFNSELIFPDEPNNLSFTD